MLFFLVSGKSLIAFDITLQAFDICFLNLRKRRKFEMYMAVEGKDAGVLKFASCF